MVNVWVLTILFASGWGTAVQTYEFKNREECVAAQNWYKEKFSPYLEKTTCYPSLPTKK